MLEISYLNRCPDRRGFSELKNTRGQCIDLMEKIFSCLEQFCFLVIASGLLSARCDWRYIRDNKKVCYISGMFLGYHGWRGGSIDGPFSQWKIPSFFPNLTKKKNPNQEISLRRFFFFFFFLQFFLHFSVPSFKPKQIIMS